MPALALLFSPTFWMIIGGVFLFGNTTGGFVVYKIWNVAYMQNQIETYKKDNKLFRDAAGIATKIDDESEQVKSENEKLVRDILAGLKQPDPIKEEHYVYVQVPLGVPVPGKAPSRQKRLTGKPVCVTADSMRALGSLKW